jgi:hypothetical protein
MNAPLTVAMTMTKSSACVFIAATLHDFSDRNAPRRTRTFSCGVHFSCGIGRSSRRSALISETAPRRVVADCGRHGKCLTAA